MLAKNLLKTGTIATALIAAQVSFADGINAKASHSRTAAPAVAEAGLRAIGSGISGSGKTGGEGISGSGKTSAYGISGSGRTGAEGISGSGKTGGEGISGSGFVGAL